MISHKMNRSTSNSEHFLEALKRLFNNGVRDFSIKVSYMADPESHYRPRWSPFMPKSYIMTYEIVAEEPEEIPTDFYDPEVADKITQEGRKTLKEILKNNPTLSGDAPLE